jgi:protoporphyrinogen oxidase
MPLADLPADCVGAYFPVIDHGLALEGAREPTDYSGYNGTFYYPSSGRLGDTAEALAAPLNVRYGCEVTGVDLGARAIRTADGEAFPYEALISTLPLDALLRLSGEWPAPELFEATRILNFRVGFRGSVLQPFHWVYIADEVVPIHRVGFPGNVNAATCPEGCASISVEYTYPRDGQPLETERVVECALDHLAESGLLEIDEILTVSERLISPSYVVYRSAGRPEFDAINELLREGGVALAGRFGTWDYLSIEESFESGWRVGRTVGAAAHV